MKVPAQLKRKAAELRREIDEHNRRYYVLSTPTISDAEFDELFRELSELEEKYPSLRTPDSPTQKVGSGMLGGLPIVQLRRPMLSLPSLFSEDEVRSFDMRVKSLLGKSQVDYIGELKFDGVAVNLTYEKGKLAQAALRGTGTEGEDVTQNVLSVSGIPHNLKIRDARPPRLLEVRGEVVMTRSDFRALNKSLEERGKKKAVNPRNAASGALRQFRGTTADRKPLRFFAYGLGDCEGFTRPKTQSQYWKQLEGFGFEITENRTAESIEELFLFFHDVERRRDTFDFDIDGVVYKVDRLEDQDRLGFIGKDVRWAVAHKFKAETKQTRLLRVEFQVGRTGVLTPVAKLDPVFVGQASVSSATLHNERQIAEKGIHINDLVFIRRAGDVIPEVVSVAKEGSNRIPIVFPKKCPVCDSHVERNGEKTSAWCTGGLVCSAQVKQRILHFCSKGAMNIEGIGDKLVEVLVDEINVSTPADIFRLPRLTKEWLLETSSKQRFLDVLPVASRNSPLMRRVFADKGANDARVSSVLSSFDDSFLSTHDGAILLLATIPKSPDDSSSDRRRRLGEKDALTLVGQIDGARSVSFQRLLFALGIRHIGKEMALRLASKGYKWQNLVDMNWDAELEKKERIQKENAKRRKANEPLLEDLFAGMGPEIIGSLKDFFAEPHNVEVANDLLAEGVQIRYDSMLVQGALSGQTFLFTGTLSRRRDEVEAQVRELGAKILSGVSKNLTHLVVGENPGGKLEKAKELGVDILNEAQYERLIAKAQKEQ